MGGHGTVEDENLSTNYLSKPLFSWILPFVQGQLPQEESFSEFVASNVLQQVLNFLGIAQTPADPSWSSLTLFGTWDEDLGSGGSSMVTTRPNHDGETRERIQKLSGIVQLVESHYMDELNILSVTSPPNVVHMATFCKGCAVLEMEKLLRLILGAAVRGNQKQETMRKIKELPSKVQEQLILEIKQVTDVADLVELKSWTDFHALPQEKQETNYGNLLSRCQLLLRERNSLLKWRQLTEYAFGLTKCENEGSYRSGTEKNSFDLDQGDRKKCGAGAMRQLKEELSEKSELLKECREELEMTKSKVQEMHKELSEMRTQLKSFKTRRDEFDILREGQERALRLEAELVRMRKKVEESEQYYEQTHILENENKVYQRKHAILTDRINVLTVENERLELSLLTHQSHRSPFHLNSPFPSDQPPPSFSYTPNLNSFTDQLLLDSDEDKDIQTASNQFHSNTTSTCIQAEQVSLSEFQPTPACSKNRKDAETQEGGLDIQNPSKSSQRDRKSGRSKRSHRKSGAWHGKRTKKTSLFPPSKVTLNKVKSLDTLPPDKQPPQTDVTCKGPRSTPNRKMMGHMRDVGVGCGSGVGMSTESKRIIHDSESDADAELSQSPQQSETKTDSDSELRKMRPPFYNPPVEDFGSEDELLFVCTTNTMEVRQPPPMARNVRIYAPSREPLHPQYVSLHPREHLPLHPPPPQPREHATPLFQPPLSLNIHLKQQQELTVGGEVSLRHAINDHHTHTPTHFTQIQPPNCASNSTTDEDDNSIWYEYGCV